MLLDSHCHLAPFGDTAPQLVERALQAGVETLINVCTNPEEVEHGLQLQKSYPQVHLVAATTPHKAEKEGETAFPVMERYARAGTLVGIGETGLDYHYYLDSKHVQQKYLRLYLALAKDCDLPVVIHCREAFTDLFDIIDTDYRNRPGVLHCFTGNKQEAFELIDRGWTLSFSGIVTFKKSTDLQEIAALIPDKQLLIETDAPYLAPRSKRGKTNEPAYIGETAAFIANLRGTSLEALATLTSQNARSLFKLS